MLLPIAILAGGLASRLRPLTDRKPKAMIDVFGEPFISHQLRLLRSKGMDRVVLCIGHLGHLIREFVGDGSRFGLSVIYSDDGGVLRGTGGAIQAAIPLLGERFFVLYGDSYLPCDYAQVQVAFERSGQQGLMTICRNEGKWDASNVEFCGGRILDYNKFERSARLQYIDYGLGVFDRTAFDLSGREAPFDLSTVYQDLLGRGELAGYEVAGRFYEIGSTQGIADLCDYIRLGEAIG